MVLFLNPLCDLRGKHGAEICELTGLFVLNGLKNIIPGLEFGLYRDIGIVSINEKTSRVEI